MPLTDLPLDVLRDFRPEIREPADFDAFWTKTLAESRAAGADVPVLHERADTPVTGLVIEDLTFPGFGGEPVKAWLTRPLGSDGARLPTVVEYNGYNGGRGLPGERVGWALAGFVHVLMDTRGQGSGWGSGGDTPDPHGSGPAQSGWMTRGIDDPADHYYRRVYTDAARLLDAVRALPEVDPARVAVAGGSQGGGIAIAAAGLVPDVWAVMPDVAFLCAWERGLQVATSDPFQELARYLAVHRDQRETLLTTASYLDGVNFAKRITAPALFSVALMDDVVPPSTTFAAYNALGSADKKIEVYPENGHEGGQTYQWLKQVEFLKARGA